MLINSLAKKVNPSETRTVWPSPPKSTKFRRPSIILQTRSINYQIFINSNPNTTKAKSGERRYRRGGVKRRRKLKNTRKLIRKSSGMELREGDGIVNLQLDLPKSFVRHGDSGVSRNQVSLRLVG